MIPAEELKVEVWPERDKGGQHVGIVTGVRITHLPTGIMACCQTNRSQHRNRQIALEMIEAALTSPNFR